MPLTATVFSKRPSALLGFYLAGFVSRLYCPAQGWRQTEGDLGVIIGITAPKRP